jgi:PAS domain-containing protein
VISSAFDAIPHIVVIDGMIDYVAPAVAKELGCNTNRLQGQLNTIGTRLDTIGFEQLCNGEAPLMIRLGAQLADRPVRLRRLGMIGHRTWIEIRLLANVFGTAMATLDGSTQLTQTERALHSSNRSDEALDLQREEFVIVFNEAGQASYTSSSVLQVLGDNAKINDVNDFVRYIHPSDQQALVEKEQQVRNGTLLSGSVEFRIETPDAIGQWHQANLTNLLNEVDVQGLVLSMRNVHGRHMTERELYRFATHDLLTTLLDRGGLLLSL